MGKPPESHVWVFQSILLCYYAIMVHMLSSGYTHFPTCGFVDMYTYRFSWIDKIDKPSCRLVLSIYMLVGLPTCWFVY
jgi:hypothetical protein